MTRIYYNEIDKVAAQWLRNLIDAGHIAPGDVDERSIEDVEPVELAGYTQCHFFAGIGIWSYSLRRAGWPDDRPVWTGSCPCQPFSPAGKGDGFDDERHLWPAFDWLIGQCRPPTVLGEQVDGTDGMVWNDLVSTDLEEKGYAFGAAIIPAAGFAVDYLKTVYGEWLERAIHDCPDSVVAGMLRDFARWAGGNLGVGGAHIRHRQYWIAQRLADANGRDASAEREQPGGQHGFQPQDGGAFERLANAAHEQRDGAGGGGSRWGLEYPDSGAIGGLDDAERDGRRSRRDYYPADDRKQLDANVGTRWLDDSISARLEGHAGDGDGSYQPRRDSADQNGSIAAAGGAGGVDDSASARHIGPQREAEGNSRDETWMRLPSASSGACDADASDIERRVADWLYCRDGSWRPVGPGTFPPADDATARVGRLRAYGNGLDAETATGFIKAVMDVVD